MKTSTETETSGEKLGVGLLGCGAFGRFCLREFGAMPGLRAAAVADTIAEAARKTGEEFGLPVCADVHALAARDDVQIIHIATPPSTHCELAMAALDAGKHVLCEKPLATNLADARRMIDAARMVRRFLAVNLIMRYDPLNQAVARILKAGLLGAPLHAFFENYAGDTPLGPGHWFWKPEISGGIFIEHGVHFFDLFRMWFGPGQVVAAQQSERPESGGIIDQVHCTVRYGGVLLANFYHGFHQSSRMEAQEARIVCERGTIRLFEWVPTRIEIDLLASHADLEAVRSIVPQAEVEELARYEGGERDILARHKSFPADGRFCIRGDTGISKQELYGRVVRELLADQIRSIDDPQHRRLVSEENGLTSLEIAVDADELAQKATAPTKPTRL
ncbi:MAG TPA: Gfo/Idh/MocA family oxidoreductase [Terrimicrobiaceae bacterium]|nr:Gfo/Idh/MocA family oxidoreductase [Terrimicrobiaceae bacterium]